MKILLTLLAIAALAAPARSETTAPKAPAKTTPAEKSATKPAAKDTAKSSSKEAATDGKTLIGDVDGIVCSFCVQGIQKIFKSKGKADEVVISLELKKVFVAEKVGQTITEKEFADTIRNAGFKTISLTRSKLSLKEAKDRVARHMPLVAEASTAKAASR